MPNRDEHVERIPRTATEAPNGATEVLADAIDETPGLTTEQRETAIHLLDTEGIPVAKRYTKLAIRGEIE